MDYSDVNGEKKMTLYRKLYTKEKKYDEAADVVIAYLKANNIDIKAENPTSTDELGQIVWDVSDIYNKLFRRKTKRSYGFNGQKFAERC